LYSSPNFYWDDRIKETRWEFYVARMRDEKCIQNFSRKTLMEENFIDIRCRCENSVEMDLTGIWYKHVDWIQLAQDRIHWRALVNTVTNLWVFIKGLTFVD
jgi:hypothetical protein